MVDNEGVLGNTASSSSSIYASSLGRFDIVSTVLIRPLLLVEAADDNINTLLGALRLSGSERVIAGAWIDRSTPLSSLID